MKLIAEPMPGLKLIKPTVIRDDRGYFFESFQEQKIRSLGIETFFVQDNEAFSTKNTLRGLHYQLPPFAQAKLVRVVKGAVLDVAVDIRQDSLTYGRSYAVILDENNKFQLFIPRGFAHGYLVLSEEALFCYKTDNFYSKESEGGIIFNDSNLDIDWQISNSKLIISDKDGSLPKFGNHRKFV